MKIIYGVSGEGLGHVFEAIELISSLKKDGHTVKVLTYGTRALTLLKEFEPVEIEGIDLQVNSKGFSLLKTILKNAHIIPYYFRNWRRLQSELQQFNPDVYITAFEPFTTLTSHLSHVPLISIDNQNELLYIKRPRHIGWFNFGVARWATRICTYGADYYIVKSFRKTLHAKENVFFVNPLIQKETRKKIPSIGSHFFVYLTKQNPQLIEILKTIPEHFIVYCHNKIGVDKNITYRPSGNAQYLEDLASCKAIIGTTGFSLIADALYLKKPYFGIPVEHQAEQVYNAYFIAEVSIGEFSQKVTAEELNHFITKLSAYRNSLETYSFDPDEQEKTLQKVLAEIATTNPSV